MATHLSKKHQINSGDKIQRAKTSQNLRIQVDHTAAGNAPTIVPIVGQMGIHQAFSSKLAPGSSRSKLISKSVGLYIATDLRPYSVVESKAFKNLLELLEPRYKLPSTTQ